MLQEALKGLAEPRSGKFGVIRTGFDWYPGKTQNDIGWAGSIEIMMAPQTARDLAEISHALKEHGYPDMDIYFPLGAVTGESLCNAAISLRKEMMDPDAVDIAGPKDYEWKEPDGFQCGVKVNQYEVRIEIRDEDELPLGVAIFDPERLSDLISAAASDDKAGQRKKEKASPKM